LSQSNKEEAVRRLDELREGGLKGLSVTWAPGAHELSEEELCKSLVDMLDTIEERNTMSTEDKMRLDFITIYEYVQKAMGRLSYNRMEEIPFSELQKRAWDAWASLDLALLIIGNWLTLEERISIKKRVRERLEIND
jgi:hypothetical protein